MECSCDASNIDCYEGAPELYKKIIRKANKHHKCNECYRIIKPAEQYIIENFLFEGSWNRHKVCNSCEQVRKIFFPNGYYFERIWEDLAEFIHEVHGEIPEDCISKLPQYARDKVCDLVEKTLDYFYEE